MLEKISTQGWDTDLIRLASCPDVDRFLENEAFDKESTEEVRQLLRSVGAATGPEEHLERSFRPKHRLAKTKYATRFSDGSFPVLYGALEVKTAEMEVRHGFSMRVGKPTAARTGWYRRLTYRFRGEVKDLRPMQSNWAALTSDDYGFCNELGREAVAAGLDGLLAPSARRKGGTNLPAFTRRAVSEVREGEFVAVTYDPVSGKVSAT